MMSRHRRELRPCRKKGGEMEYAIDLELREDAIEQRGIGNGSGELPADL